MEDLQEKLKENIQKEDNTNKKLENTETTK
jgi:hypothetical protein